MVKILLTGATGYIGGSVLTELLSTQEFQRGEYQISVLVRNSTCYPKFLEKGVEPISFSGLDDLERIRQVSSQFDVVINTAASGEAEAAKAMVEGLGDRRRSSGSETVMIHNSGTSILADHSHGKVKGQMIFSDLKDDIYDFEANHQEVYSQRVTDVAVIDAGLAHGVKTFIIVPPTIYGRGTGLFSVQSQQVPWLARLAIKQGRVKMINQGLGVWNHIHISDLTPLFSLILSKALKGEDAAPDGAFQSGKKGIYFAQSGEHTWLEVAQGIAKAGKELGVLSDEEVESLSIEDFAQVFEFGNHSLQVAALGYSSNSRARDDRARALGWAPKRGDDDFYKHFLEEVKLVASEFK
ncbi:NAD dependent epimerase/dehydratase family protein [Violaceomyces palustris]|uniref:NAD dependent epimerase/dehydratase family protein n=1 Tax=Violaceomyces palustris TaxID=1673888 RepID=A0ACD0NTS6_9BASI|nr:NAD dependent epimerase/dehydratase family protein [Violaceomyces palustris]